MRMCVIIESGKFLFLKLTSCFSGCAFCSYDVTLLYSTTLGTGVVVV